MKYLSNYPAYENYYHFVGATKFRKDMFYHEEIRTKLKSIIAEVISHKENVELLECTVAYNHIHALLKTDLPPAQVAQVLFGASSRLLRKEFPSLKEQNELGLWGGKSCEAIKDATHLKNCISYIQRHQPDNTKL